MAAKLDGSDGFMSRILIPIPQTLYDRIATRAEELGMTAEQLAGVWLWQIEREKGINGYERSETWTAASRDDGDLSTGQDG